MMTVEVDELTPFEILTLMNCWMYCPQCNGWGIIFLEAGIPNKVATCFECGGTGVVWS